MINIKYKLTEVDYLQLNLYYFDVEGSLRSNSLKILFTFLSIIIILIVVLIYEDANSIFPVSLSPLTFFILIFHKQQVKKDFFKIFKKNIQQYKNRFDKNVELKFTEAEIEVKSIAGNSQFYNSQIKSINETKEYFFIRLQPEAIIIPKRELEEVENVRENLDSLAKKLNVEYKNDLNWEW